MRFFGSEGQQKMARQAAALWGLLRDDPRFAWYGRNVTLVDYHASGPDFFADLVRVQGATVAYQIARDDVDEVLRDLEARGLGTDFMGFSMSEDGDSVARAKQMLERHALPADIVLSELGPGSGDDEIDAFAEIALGSGVLPPPDAVLRREAMEGVALLARERESGRPVGCSASFRNFHPDSVLGDHCFWGMLSTHPDRRGEKIAAVLGAESMVRMHARTGIGKFITGIRDDNAASSALCAKFGVVRTRFVLVIGMDRAAFGEGRVTT